MPSEREPEVAPRRVVGVDFPRDRQIRSPTCAGVDFTTRLWNAHRDKNSPRSEAPNVISGTLRPCLQPSGSPLQGAPQAAK